jgi:hypothetical protein
MRLLFGAVVLAFFSASASAVTVVADYQGNYTSPTPASGWKYMWNPAGVPLFSNPATFTGNSANYVSLSYNSTGGAYETQSTGLLPLASPGGYLSAAHSYVTLGQNGTLAADGNTHYAIIDYTYTNAQVAADGQNLVFHT